MAPLVVILAGGEGSRIGGGKPFRTLGGERLIDRALRAARDWSDDVRIALRSPGQAGGLDLPVLLDDPGLEGPLAGLASALAAAGGAGRRLVLTAPCDAPFLPHDLAFRLQEAIGGNGAALAEGGGDLQPACALWRTWALERLPDYLRTGRRSLLGFAETIGFARARWDPACFLNVNTPEDLAKAERRLASEINDLDQRSRPQGGMPGP